MAFVVAATWKAKPDEAGRITDVIRTMTPLSRAERSVKTYETIDV
jgi:hypothetical protein